MKTLSSMTIISTLNNGPDYAVLQISDDSLNGTFVNGEKIVGKVKIKPGDTLSFGGEPVFAVMRSALAHA